MQRSRRVEWSQPARLPPAIGTLLSICVAMRRRSPCEMSNEFSCVGPSRGQCRTGTNLHANVRYVRKQLNETSRHSFLGSRVLPDRIKIMYTICTRIEVHFRARRARCERHMVLEGLEIRLLGRLHAGCWGFESLYAHQTSLAAFAASFVWRAIPSSCEAAGFVWRAVHSSREAASLAWRA